MFANLRSSSRAALRTAVRAASCTALRAAAGAALTGLALLAAPAAAVQVTCSSPSGLAGGTVDVAINTTTLTGQGVLAFQFELNYNPAVVTPTAVLEAGALTGAAGWGAAEFSVQPIGASQARLSVSDAGTTALVGAGPLLFLRFALNPALLGGGATSLTFVNFTYNEGAPADTTTGGAVTVNPTPQITVSPATGTVYRTSTLQFNLSGSVTNPVTWATTDPAIATISATGLLTGVAPGTVRVFAVDAAARRDTTDGLIEVRGMRVTANSASVVQGLDVSVPLVTTSLNGLGVRSGQFVLTYNAGLVTPVAVTAPPGTLLSGYGPIGFGIPTPGTLAIDFAGDHDLTGSGSLCLMTFTASATATGGTTLGISSALFNETLPAVTVNGTLSVTGVGSLFISPDQVTLLAGQTQQYTATGSPTPTPPIVWSVLDPVVASISGTGLLTALSGGDTQVRAQDALGALDFTTAVHVYDFAATLGTVQGPPGATVRVPLTSDRTLGALGIYSLQYTVQWSGTAITAARAHDSGLTGLWNTTGVVTLAVNPRITIAGAGATPLDDSGLEIHAVEFDISPSTTNGTNIPLTVTSLLFNEGAPRALVTSGAIQVRTTADAGAPPVYALSLSPCEPNPMRTHGSIRLTLPRASARVRLAIYALDGRLVRQLHDGALAAGPHELSWDGRDDAARALAAGLYFCRLETPDQALTRKLALTP